MKDIYDNGTRMLGQVKQLKEYNDNLYRNKMIEEEQWIELAKELVVCNDSDIVSIDYDNGMGISMEIWEEIKVWTSPIRRVGDNRPNYMYSESKNSIDFRTIKDKKELGWLDKNKGILYLNDRYRMNFKAIKNQIIKDYQPKSISEYINLI